MAPKGGKRSAAASAGRPTKKPTVVEDPTAEKCAEIEHGLVHADLPSSAKSMLKGAVKHSVGTFKDLRDSYQEAVVTMVGEALGTISAWMSQNISECQAKVEAADSDKQARDVAHAAADANVSALRVTVGSKKADVTAADEENKAATGDLLAKIAEQHQGNIAFEEAAGNKKSLEDTFNNIFLPMKTAAGDATGLKALAKAAAEFGFDSSIVEHMSPMLKKDPEHRGTFDMMAVTQLEQEFSTNIAKFDSILQGGDEQKVARDAAVDAAQAVVNDTKSKLEAASEALHNAQVAEKEGRQTLRTAERAVGNFMQDLHNNADALDAAKEAFEEFQSGAYAAFKFLADRVEPKPEPEMPEALEVPHAQEV